MEGTLGEESVHAGPIGRNHEKDRNLPLKTGKSPRYVAFMSNCYLCGCALEDHINESTANHFEHIIPQAIGGQLTVRDILCKACGGHERLGGKIDKPFSDMFRLITDRIDMKRDRKTEPVPLKAKLRLLDDGSEFEVHLMEDVLSAQKPHFRVDHERKRVQVFANRKVAKDYKRKVERDLVQSGKIDDTYVVEVVSDMAQHPEFFGMLEIPFKLDNKTFEAGFAKMAIEFALSQGVPFQALSHLVNRADLTINSEGTLLPYYPIFKPEEVIEYLRTSLDENFMSHSLVLFSQRQIQEDGTETKQLYCFVELFGTFQHFVRLNNHYVGDNIDPITYSQKIINEQLIPVDMTKLRPKEVMIYMNELGMSLADIQDKSDEEARKMVQRKYDSQNRYVFDYAENTKRIVDRILLDSILNSKEVITGMAPEIVYHFYRDPDTDDFHILYFRSRFIKGRGMYSIIPAIEELYAGERGKFHAYTSMKFHELEAFINSNSKRPKKK